MMGHKLIILALVMAPGFVKAQRVNFTLVNAGYSLTNVKSNNYLFKPPLFREPEFAFHSGYSFSLEHGFWIKERWSLSTGIQYQQRGYRIAGRALGPVYMEYLGVPFRLGWTYTVSPGKWMRTIRGRFIPAILYDKERFSRMSDRLDMAFALELGVGRRMGKRWSLWLMMHYQRSITQFPGGELWPDEKLQHYQVGFSLEVKRYHRKREKVK